MKQSTMSKNMNIKKLAYLKKKKENQEEEE